MLGIGLGLTQVATRKPAYWWADGAIMAVQATTNRYMLATQRKTLAETLSVSRSTTKYGEQGDGTLQLFQPNIPVVTDTGLLVEPDATNLVLHSEDFTNAVWVKSGTITTNIDAVSRTGLISATTLNDTDAANISKLSQGITVPNDNQQYQLSIDIKKTTGGTSPTFGINAVITGGTVVGHNVRFNLDTGQLLSGAGATVLDKGDWWRIVIDVVNNTTGNTSFDITIIPAHDAHGLSAGDVTITGSAIIFGAQLETGPVATSYTPTTSVAVTRTADIITFADTSWFNNAGPSTFVFDIEWLGDNATRFYGLLEVDFASGGTDKYDVGFHNGLGIPRVTLTTAATDVVDARLTPATANPGDIRRMAVGWDSATVRNSTNGAAVQTATITGALPTVSATPVISLGSRLGSMIMNARIRSMTYFPALKSDAELRALSTQV